MMINKKSIIYVNFAPYENSGWILDFLRENFLLVILFSFDFHRLNNKSQSNRIIIFRAGEKSKTIKLFSLPTPEALLFITLPFIASVIFIQTFYFAISFKRRYKKIDYYLTVNAFTAWVGILLRRLGVIQKTIFWVWDYYPPGYKDWRIRFARWAYWRFDKWSSSSTDKIIFLNKKLIELRKDLDILSKRKSYKVIPIGTNPTLPIYNKKLIIGHLGVLKKGQGFDLLIDSMPQLLKRKQSFLVEVVGSGPDEQYFRNKARKYKNIKFYGFIESTREVESIIQKWSIGLATYIPNKSNESAWTDPSKIKAYISKGVPVITTNVTDFSKEISSYNAGVIVDGNSVDEFANAVNTLLTKQTFYKPAALKLARKYYYKKIYKDLFN